MRKKDSRSQWKQPGAQRGPNAIIRRAAFKTAEEYNDPLTEGVSIWTFGVKGGEAFSSKRYLPGAT